MKKFCTKCKKIKLLKNFSSAERMKDGYSNWCKQCHNSYKKLWRKVNHEKAIKASKNWRIANPEKNALLNKAWIEKNLQRFKKIIKAWHASHPGKKLSICKFVVQPN